MFWGAYKHGLLNKQNISIPLTLFNGLAIRAIQAIYQILRNVHRRKLKAVPLVSAKCRL